MTKEPIMIDGIDVSECRFFIDEYIEDFQDDDCFRIYNVCCISQDECENNKDCYYKQLKRKEQECEEAKQNAQDTYDFWQALIESFNILQGEKIKLEKECKWWKHQAELGSDTTNRLAKQLEEKEQELDSCREILHKQLDQLKAENEKLKTKNTILQNRNQQMSGSITKNEIYKQALQEIKEFAESVTGDGSKCENCETEGYCADCEDEILKQILQKCEVIDD